MWHRIADWHREWKGELFGMLEQPGHAAVVQSVWRRRLASRIVAMTPVERRQIHAFAVSHRDGVAAGCWPSC